MDEALQEDVMEFFEEGNMLMAERMENVYIQGMRMGAQMAAALLQEENTKENNLSDSD